MYKHIIFFILLTVCVVIGTGPGTGCGTYDDNKCFSAGCGIECEIHGSSYGVCGFNKTLGICVCHCIGKSTK